MLDENKLQSNLVKYAKLIIATVKNNEMKTVDTKTSETDLVTNIDRLVEKRLVEAIKIDYPIAKIVSEEFNHQAPSSLTGLIFFVDPIDGTMNYVHQHDFFASMIGVYVDGQPFAGLIVDLSKDNIYFGTKSSPIYKNDQVLHEIPNFGPNEGLISVGGRFVLENLFNVRSLIKQTLGLRIYGSAGITFIQLLEQKQIGYISRLAPWDLAAGRFLAEKLGFIVTKIDGTPPTMLKSENVIISTKQLHEIAIEHLHDEL